MQEIIHTPLIVLHILACCFLILVVLLQPGKSGGLGAFTGAAAQQVFGGRGAGNILTKITWTTATTFFLTSFTLAYLSSSADDSLAARSESYDTLKKGPSPYEPPGTPAPARSTPATSAGAASASADFAVAASAAAASASADTARPGKPTAPAKPPTKSHSKQQAGSDGPVKRDTPLQPVSPMTESRGPSGSAVPAQPARRTAPAPRQPESLAPTRPAIPSPPHPAGPSPAQPAPPSPPTDPARPAVPHQPTTP
ncbi:preprotein translocase subunit SecG [Myxococcota bacterium]